MRSARFVAIGTIALGVGCGGRDGKDTAGGSCDETVTLRGPDDPTPLGVTGRQLAELTTAPRTTTGVWAHRGTTVEITITGSWDASGVEIHALEPRVGAPDDDPGAACPDYVSFPLTATLASADGALADTWSATATAWVGSEVELSATKPIEAVSGTWSPAPAQTWDWDRAALNLDNAWQVGSVRGGLSLESEGSGGDGVGKLSVDAILAW